MKHKRLLGIAVTLAMVGASLLAATPAVAAGPSDVVYSSTAPMNIIGYDKAVAEANGFTIVTDQDGTQHSVPVTKQAKAQVAAANSVVKPLNTVYGDCGTSSLYIQVKWATVLMVSTGYSVVLASVSHIWNVDGAVSSGTWSNGFSGLNFSTTWSATHNVNVGNGAHGFGSVRPGSEATLINGVICASGGPSDSW